MAATAEGKTSIRPHCRDWIRAVVLLEAIRGLMVQFGSARKRRNVVARPNSSRKVTHGQAMRDLRQDAAVRTPRQPRQEPGEPEVPAQPADGARDRVWKDLPRAGLHALPEDVLGLAEVHSVDLAQQAEVLAQGAPHAFLGLPAGNDCRGLVD